MKEELRGVRVSKIDKQRERWNRIKSQGKKRHVLKILFFYVVFALILTTVNVFVLNRLVLTYFPYVISLYIMSIVIFSLLGIWVGNRTWNANIKKFGN
jgi:membrane glycosyltransferase